MMRGTMKQFVIALTAAALLVLVPSVLAVEATGPAGALGINAGLLLAQTINFLVVAALLYFMLVGPLGRMLDARTAKIKKGLEDAAEAANARRNAVAEAEKIKTEARAEIQKSVEEGRQRGEQLAESIREEAKAEAEKIKADARAAAEQARDAELAGLRDQVANISIALANRLIGEALDEQRQKALISDFFSKVPDNAKASMSGKVTVVSAMPLEDAEKSRIQSEIGSDDIEYVVDPNILGGLVLRSADTVVDGSVRSGLNDIAGRLR